MVDHQFGISSQKDMISFLQETLFEAFVKAFDGEGLSASNISVELSKDASHGDFASSLALMLAKKLKKSPRDIAQVVVAILEREYNHVFDKVEIAGAGFINMTLSSHLFEEVWGCLLEEGRSFGSSAFGRRQSCNVEYVSGNPTGPLHVGHARGAVVGDVLANILQKVGYNVCREYYINDFGGQIDTLARSSYLRYKEALGEEVTIPEGLYPGVYLKEVGQALKEKYQETLLQKQEEEWLPLIREEAVNMMLALIKGTLHDLGIYHDVFSSEKALTKAGRVAEAVDLLQEKGYLYKGVLPKPKGKNEDWEERPQLLFKSTEFGDDCDRALQKSDGAWTYFAGDIGYHYDKCQRGFVTLYNVLGADHAGYFKRIKASVLALTDRKIDLNVVSCQIVSLRDGGIPLKMSKRAGSFVTLQELVDDVGSDAVRIWLLTRKSDAPVDFDLKLVKEENHQNPVFYMQYAHARCCSILRMASDHGMVMDDILQSYDFSLLQSSYHRDLLRYASVWGDFVKKAAVASEPHRIVYFMIDVASKFHALWTEGKKDKSLRFIDENNPERTKAYLAFVYGVKMLLQSGFDVLGVTPLESL